MNTALSAEDLARRAAELERRAASAHPESWRPDDAERGHPQTVTGVLVRVDEGTTPFGQKRIVVLETLAGELWGIWLLHGVLIDEFAKLRPAIGELVSVRYEGRKPVKHPQPGRASHYEAYRVLVDRGEGPAVEWGERAPPAVEHVHGFAGVVPEADVPPEPHPAVDDAIICDACGMRNGHHTDGCPLDTIPF